ncbi:MAG TPA: anti-sigma factor domain-containing protein [Acetivibrio clariflavus]|nr:anti-sigma factor domain-containing protein [Acetivibrio clariflavus]
MKIEKFLSAKNFIAKNCKKIANKQILNFFGKKTAIQNDYQNEYIDTIKKIKQGDQQLKKDFINKHKGFILESISHSLGRSAIPKNSPEFDVGLDAFDYSIDLFNPEKENDFLSFSEQIIREWILDYVKQENLNNSLRQIDEEKYYLYCNNESTKDIAQFKRSLWEYGIKLSDLPNLTPDEKQNIGVCVRIAKQLAIDDRLFQKVTGKKTLSVEDFNDGIKLERRLFNKYKKYIIALTLIIKNNLRLLCSYLRNVNLRNDLNENIGVILEIKNNQAILFTLKGEFLTVKLSTSNKVGEQIKFGSYRIQRKNKYQNYIIAAWAFTSVLICIIVFNGFKLIINNRTPAFSYSTVESPLPNQTVEPKSTSSNTAVDNAHQVGVTPAPDLTGMPKNTSSLLVSEPLSTELPATNRAVSTAQTIPTSSPNKIAAATPAPSIAVTPSQTADAVVPSQTANALPTSTAITKATGIPGEARISVHPPKVKVGEKYEVHFYMKGGNNGTTLILYQNEVEYKRFELVDRTPRDQARILSFDATKPGTYNYRWELINEFGTTSSKTVTVTVVE